MYKCSPLLCAAAAAIREGILGLIRSPINVKDKRALLSLLLFGGHSKDVVYHAVEGRDRLLPAQVHATAKRQEK